MIKGKQLTEEISKLTIRQIAIVQCSANDLTRPEIAATLKISKRTVDQKIWIMKDLFEVKHEQALIALFFRNNLIQ